jgi:hypothetical protein
LTVVIDVIIPIPLPLSAILILVIGELSLFTRSFVIDGHAPDLGFELLVAVRLVVPLFLSSMLITWLGSLVIICVGQGRDRGQRDADASTEAWYDP